MSTSAAAILEQRLGATLRRDAWWGAPALMAGALVVFGIYAFWAALQNGQYRWGPYLSPFYSPLMLPDWWAFSPAFLVLWVPLGFRATCYYFRRVYYRAFLMDPPACSVGEPDRAYAGETKLFLFQNLHRFFLYLALILILTHSYDLFHAIRWPVNGIGPDGMMRAGSLEFGIGVGTLVIALDVLLLSLYVFGCHSWRHLVGGNVDCYSCALAGRVRHGLWHRVTMLNERHALWGWTSLIWVGLTDLYIRLCAMGIISDVRII